jgi:hypothetical protein
MTLNELLFAEKHQENYHLYRVFNANDPERVQVKKIVNPAKHIRQQKLLLYVCRSANVVF